VVRLLWHGLPTMPLGPTGGLNANSKKETFGQVAWRGQETTPQQHHHSPLTTHHSPLTTYCFSSSKIQLISLQSPPASCRMRRRWTEPP